jgi:hypothetical protein
MIVLGLAFLGYGGLLLYTDLVRPEPLGLLLQVQQSGVTVRAVAVDSLAAHAGLAADDRVVAANSHPTRSRLDWMSVEMNLRTNQPLRLDVERGAVRLAFTLVPTRATSRYWLTGAGVTLAIARFVQLIALMLALTVAFRRPFSPAARVGAWTLATIGVYSITWQYQLGAIWRALPMPLGLALWIPFTCSLAIAAVVFTFFATFPRPLIRSRLGWLAVWMPAAVVLVFQLQCAVRVVYQPDRIDPFLDWTSFSAVVVAAYVIATMAVVVIGYRRLTDVTERRRVRVLVVGSSIGLLSLLPVVSLYWGRSPSTFGDSVFASPLAAAGAIVGLALPISFAHAILRHRLFDVRLMLRLGLQYALARRVLVSVVPIMAMVFLADLWINRQVPVAEILRARGWMYATFAAVAIIARWQRNDWLDALDRRYFRERLNAQRLLRGISEEIRNATALDEIAARVVARIEAALHPAFVALLVRRSSEALFQAVAISPDTTGRFSLPATSKLIDVVRMMKKPVQFEDLERSWLFRHLPASDVEWLARTGVEALVPIQLDEQMTEAIFALGPKRSEEPYTAEDDDLLMAIADNVAWLLRRTAPPAARAVLEECPACGQCFDVETGRCAHDGAALTVTSLPRVIGGRYVLERRVGRGGMGAVYAALDRSLNRPVAVKVLREDLFIPGGVDRFRSEARLAAALAHRNVVTIHDIGVTESGRAFFIMELLNGTTLRDELRQTGRLPPARVLRIMRDVGSGVDAAHRRQMVHRDLKPENVFLCRDDGVEVAKVLDFGLAKALEASGGVPTMFSAPGMIAGTPQYMAPEHLSGGEPSSDWDLWAIAVMAFEMITGSLPTTGSARSLDGLPSESLRAFFARALSQNPIDRPATVDEFLDELARELSAIEHARL